MQLKSSINYEPIILNVLVSLLFLSDCYSQVKHFIHIQSDNAWGMHSFSLFQKA